MPLPINRIRTFEAHYVCTNFTTHVSCWGTPLDSSNDEGYKLGAGDVVRVQVYGHPDMGREVTIPTRCSVELPFVGAVPVCGATTGVGRSAYSGTFSGRLLGESRSDH